VLEIEAVHGRSDGTLDGRVEIRLRPDGDGTRVELEPDFVLAGHAPTVSAEQLAAAGARLIPRWFAQLAGSGASAPPAPVPLTVVPEPEPEAEPALAPEPEPAAALPEPAPTSPTDESDETDGEAVPAEPAAPEPAPEPAPAFPTEARPGPTFTLIPGAGDAQDSAGPPSPAKAPLRLVTPREPDAEPEFAEERDLWSDRPGRPFAPVWVIGAALFGALGLLLALLRRIARHRRDVH